MNISELQKTSAKSYVGDRLYFHNNYGFMIVGFHENWKEIFWLEEEKEHGYFYLVSAPYDDDPSLWEKVMSLRNNGEIVIFNGELGSEEANYSLLKKNGKWEKNKI